MQIFCPGADTLAKVLLASCGAIPIILDGLVYSIMNSPYATGQDVTRNQPISFSHEHHVGCLGLDCRYCHTSAEKARFAGLPDRDMHDAPFTTLDECEDARSGAGEPCAKRADRLAARQQAAGLRLLRSFDADALFPAAGLLTQLNDVIQKIDLTEIVVNEMLAFLQFAGALHADLEKLRTRAVPVFLLAVFGTILSAATVGLAFWTVCRLAGHDLPLSWALVFDASSARRIRSPVRGFEAAEGPASDGRAAIHNLRPIAADAVLGPVTGRRLFLPA